MEQSSTDFLDKWSAWLGRCCFYSLSVSTDVMKISIRWPRFTQSLPDFLSGWQTTVLESSKVIRNYRLLKQPLLGICHLIPLFSIVCCVFSLPFVSCLTLPCLWVSVLSAWLGDIPPVSSPPPPIHLHTCCLSQNQGSTWSTSIYIVWLHLQHSSNHLFFSVKYLTPY